MRTCTQMIPDWCSSTTNHLLSMPPTKTTQGLTEEELLARALSLSTALDPPTTTDLPVAEYVAHVDAALPLATAAVSLPLPTDEGQQEGNDSAGQGVQVEEAAEEEEEAAEEEEENASNTNNTNGSSSASNAPRGRLPYASRFVADVTYPDGTQVAPRTAFRKTWWVGWWVCLDGRGMERLIECA